MPLPDEIDGMKTSVSKALSETQLLLLLYEENLFLAVKMTKSKIRTRSYTKAGSD